MKKRAQVITSSPAIKDTHRITEMIGNSGTSGTLNPRCRSGCDLRRKSTPSDTSTKANSVPIFDRSAASLMLKKPAGIPTAAPAIHVDQWGVLNLGWTAENNFGRSPSRDMANQIRVCPYWNTSSEEIMPISAPITITAWNHLLAPRWESAYATGALAASAFPPPNVLYFIIPSRTSATPI